MKKVWIIVIIILGCVFISSCGKSTEEKQAQDSIIYRDCLQTLRSLKILHMIHVMSSYKIEAQKDSLIWAYTTICLSTEELKKVSKIEDRFPDSIKVAFTRNGKFEEYISVWKDGYVRNKYNRWEPAYTLRTAVGDIWVYDKNGKFRLFIECPLPHDGWGHTYTP